MSIQRNPGAAGITQLGESEDALAEAISPLAEAVRVARLDRGWTQLELAHHAGVSRPTIARLEAARPVSSKTLVRVASALRLQLDLRR